MAFVTLNTSARATIGMKLIIYAHQRATKYEHKIGYSRKTKF